MRPRILASLALALCACQVDPRVHAELDRDYFRCRVQPILDGSCAMLECHGDEERPLRVFSRNRLRLDLAATKSSTGLGLPLSEPELDANYESAASFAVSPPEDSLLVRKPLDESAGGYLHDGRELYDEGDVFADAEDPDYLVLLAWLDGDEESPSCVYAGQEDAP